MSERRTDTSRTNTSGTDSTDTSGTGAGSAETSSTGRPDRRSQHEQDSEEFQAGTSYQPSTNQAQDEPLPASHHDDGRQEASSRGESRFATIPRPGRRTAAARPGRGNSERPEGVRGRGER